MAQNVMYIRRLGVELYLAGVDQPVIFPYPDQTVANLEVVAMKKLQDEFATFTQEILKPKMKWIFVIAEEALFHKGFTEEDPQQRQDAEKEYAQEVPLDPDHAGKLVIDLPDQSHVFVVNQQLYQVFLHVIEEKKGSVTSVVPYYLYNSTQPETSVFGQQLGLDAGLLQAIQNQPVPVSKANFLLSDTTYLVKEKEKGEVKTVQQKVTVAILVIIIIFSMSVSIFVVWGAIFPKKVTPVALPSTNVESIEQAQ